MSRLEIQIKLLRNIDQISRRILVLLLRYFTESFNIVVPTSIKTRHRYFGLLWHNFDHDLFKFLNDGLSHCDISFPEFQNSLDAINLQACMSSASELIINLKDPSVNVQLIGDKFSERLIEMLLVVDVLGSDWHWNISLLEDTLCTRFSGEYFCYLRIAC